MVQKRETKAINKLCVREILSLSFVCGAYFFEFRGRNLVQFVLVSRMILLFMKWRNGYLSADHYLSVYSLPFTLGLKLPPLEQLFSPQLRVIRSVDEQVPPQRSRIIL